MTPLERYRRDLQRDDFTYDVAQEQAVEHLDALYHALLLRFEVTPPSWKSFFNIKLREKPLEPVTGLYFWGGVGRGKTYLVDTFFESLPFRRKLRVHFHRFMQRVHRELRELQGEKNPLQTVAEHIAKDARVLCFDEFFVSDITDAMILAELLEQLFRRGVTLVATSNIVPDQLYENGLQRARFLPAIELLNHYTRVVNVDSGVDYRLRTLEKVEIYHYPLDQAAEASLVVSFDGLATEPGKENAQIEIEGREIAVQREADDVLWCDFAALCDGPRSQNDYIEIARIYHAVLISGVPQMTAANDDQARRFVNLVDEFYDRNVKLILSAAVAVDDLYTGSNLAFVYERTKSRLIEMQSREYLAKPHRP